jgi:RNA polymerase primary sigma factor
MADHTAPSAASTIDVTQHRRLVYWMIKRRGLDRRIALSASLSVDDLQQAGFLGLMKAAERFDEARGCTFATFAVFWVRHMIERLIEDEACTVRTPVFLQARRRKAGESPRAKVHSLDRTTGHHHGTIGLDEGTTYLEMLAAPEPEDNDTREWLPDGTTLEGLIVSTSGLTDREAQVLRLRSVGKTLDDIGDALRVTRERARQIELSAIAKVRDAQGIVVDDEVQQRIERHAARVRRSAATQAARPRARRAA